MSDRIAVMSGGKVDQVGGPREIYERPRTAFVADFIGSLNAVDVTVDELVGGFAVARPAPGERVVVAVELGVAAGDALRVAVRPERVEIAPAGSDVPPDGSRLEGSIADAVFFGMYTQFAVETVVGTVVSHRLADESLAPFQPGTPVVLSWQADQTTVL